MSCAKSPSWSTLLLSAAADVNSSVTTAGKLTTVPPSSFPEHVLCRAATLGSPRSPTCCHSLLTQKAHTQALRPSSQPLVCSGLCPAVQSDESLAINLVDFLEKNKNTLVTIQSAARSMLEEGLLCNGCSCQKPSTCLYPAHWGRQLPAPLHSSTREQVPLGPFLAANPSLHCKASGSSATPGPSQGQSTWPQGGYHHPQSTTLPIITMLRSARHTASPWT